MKKTTKSLLITSLILFCAGLLLAVTSALIVKINGIDPYGVAQISETIENKTLTMDEILEQSPNSNFSKKLSTKPFLRVDFGSYTGNIIVRSAEETSVELQNTNTANLTCEVIGETLTIRENEAVGWKFGFFIDDNGISFKGLRQVFGPGHSANTEKTIILNIAEDYNVDRLNIKSCLGDVEVSGILSDEINISLFRGVVTVSDLKSENCKLGVNGDFVDVSVQSSKYSSCNLSVKTGDLSVHLPDTSNQSTVLDALIGNISIKTDVPTSHYKLSLSSNFMGSVTRNGVAAGKELNETSSGTSRITASLVSGDISISYTGENEEDYVAPAVPEEPQETEELLTGEPVTEETATQG